MAILVDKNTKVLVQGLTGREGSFHAQKMLEYGTKLVAGVTPGKGGTEVLGLPVFNKVKEAVAATGANASVLFVPARFAYDAVLEAADAGIRLIVCITEGIPIQDMIKAVAHAKARGARLIGPNCPGIVSVGSGKLGIIPASILSPGPVGIVSRSGTLTYEILNNLTVAGIGQSTCVGIGGDPILGSRFIDLLPLFERDAATKVIVMVGEIGGSDEEEAASYIARHMKKPVIGFISGRTAPPGKRMGHAGAIIAGGCGTVASKEEAFRAAKIPLCENLSDITAAVKSALRNGVKA